MMKTIKTDHEARLDEARKLCPPIYTNFKLHKFPRFMKDALQAYKKQHADYFRTHYLGWPQTQWMFATMQSAFVHHVCDHWGSATLTRCGKGDCFVMQPYGLTAECAAQVKNAADELGLSYLIHPASQHYPGETFSVILYPTPTPTTP